MEAGHLLEDAQIWWEARAKEMLKKRQFSDEAKVQQEALNATNPVHPNYIGGKSGILLGLPWDMLTPTERNKILFAYTITLKQELDTK